MSRIIFNHNEKATHVKTIFYLYTSLLKMFKTGMREPVAKSLLEKRHILAIDYGRKYTGLATHRVNIDPIIIPFGRLPYLNDKSLVQQILKVIEDEFIDIVVLGVPLFTDGTESTMTKTIRKFGEELKAAVNIPFYLQDETLTTMEAEDRMRNDPRYNFQVDYSKIDAVSATIILEDFLNRSSDRL